MASILADAAAPSSGGVAVYPALAYAAGTRRRRGYGSDPSESGVIAGLMTTPAGKPSHAGSGMTASQLPLLFSALN